MVTAGSACREKIAESVTGIARLSPDDWRYHPWMLALLLLLLLQDPVVQDVSGISQVLREKRYAEALALTQSGLTANPKDYRIWTLQGMAQAGLNQHAEALRNLKRAIELSHDYLPALKVEAQIEYETHDPHGRETLKHILRLEPRNFVSHAMLASLSFERRDCDSVVLNYAESEALVREQPVALTQYGQCLYQVGQKAKAIDVLKSAAALDSSSWQGTYNLAVAQYLSGRASEAIETIRVPLNSPQPSPRFLELASSAYEQLGDTPRAVELLRQAIISDPSDSSLYLRFADLSFDHNSFQVGISMLNAGLQKLPDSAPLRLARGVLYIQLGEYEKAQSDFDRAAELDPTQGFSSLAQGLTELQKSNLDGALQITRDQLRRSPKDPYLHYLKAEILRQKGASPGTPSFDEALAAAKTAVQIDPSFSLAQDLLGTFYLRLNQPDLARRQFETVLAKTPNNESALYHLLIALRKSGRTSDLPITMKRLSEAKALNKNVEARRNRFAFVEPSTNH